jgi:hypothetical protein
MLMPDINAIYPLKLMRRQFCIFVMFVVLVETDLIKEKKIVLSQKKEASFLQITEV